MEFAQPQFAVRKSLQVSRTISSGAILNWGVRKMKTIIELRTVARGLSVTTNRLFLLFFLCLALPAFASAQDPLSPSNMPAIDTNPGDYPSNIWITDTMQKVRQDSGAPGTAHWGTFYGAQNEFVDFQVHVQAGSGGIANLSVTASDFVNAKTATHISASSTNIIVYREAYMDVTIKTATSNTFYNSTGFYPDILIPSVDPYWHQTTNAWPFNVAANHNQSALIDVLIPATAPSGYYLGTVTVKSGSSVLTTMPVVLAVWQWPANQGGQMPSTTTLKMELSGPTYAGLCLQLYQGNGSATNTSVCAPYPDSGGGGDGAISQIWEDMGMLLKDHRYGLGFYSNSNPGTGSFANYITLAGPYLNGTCRHGGSVCPVLPGSKTTVKTIWPTGATAASWSNWQTNFNSNGWGSSGNLPLYDYLCDEPPNGCSWATLVANGNTRHGFLNPGIPELVTTDYNLAKANGALNSIDILVPNIVILEPQGGPLQNLSNYTTWLSGSSSGITRHWWSYQSCNSAGTCGNGSIGANTTFPNYNVDGMPAANRAMEWLTYMHGQTGELYYAAEVCDDPTGAGKYCGYPTHTNNPWQSVYYSGGWGDGTLIYPGCVASGQLCYMGSGVTTPIILPSLRLKIARDGIQDYEYLNALKVAGKGAYVTSQINSWVTNSYTFETSGTGLKTARMALGTALHQLTYSVNLMPPPSLSGTLQ